MTAEHRQTPVLYCESNADGTIGGSHFCLLNLVEHLDRSRFTPIILFYEEHALVERFRASAETIVLHRRPMARWGLGARGPLAVLKGLMRRVVNACRFAALIGRHVRFLKRRRIGLVHLNNSIVRHHDWMIAALLARVPCIAHERGINDSYSPLSRALSCRMALVISMSQWIFDHMVRRGVPGANICVMYDGLDPARLVVETPAVELRRQWDVRPEQPVIGIVGNVRDWKGQHTVVDALPAIVARHPDVVCFFVGAATRGDEPYADRLHAAIRHYGIERNVRFTGFQKNVPSFVNMMSVVMHASVQPEPFGMVVLEAMAQSKPVVGSRAGGVVEMVIEGETGYTFPPGDARALARHVVDLLDNPDKARQMGANGYGRLTREFTMRRYMDDVHAAYRAIVSRTPVPAQIGLASRTLREPRLFGGPSCAE